MEIVKAKNYGFCYGVKRAIEMAQNCIGIEGSKHTLGPIIHNPQMVKKLEDQGITVADRLENICDGTVIIRSHGVGPVVYEQAKERGLQIIDATCPHVKQAQKAAKELLDDGYRVVVVGERHHPEVKSIVEWTNNTAIIIENIEDAAKLVFESRLGVVAQTTFAIGDFESIIAILATKTDDLKINRTICTATEVRQQAAVDLAEKVEVMIVIGGKNSANTSHLAELCSQRKCKVYHIETAEELRKDWFSGIKSVGITAGASTPDWVIEEVYQKMNEIANYDQEQSVAVNVGDILKGKVVEIRKDEIFVDIGAKAEGVISLAELAYPIPESAAGAVSVGEMIDVFVLEDDGGEHGIRLSKVQADRIVAWDDLEAALATQQILEVAIAAEVKGGLVVGYRGIKGFMPASQIALRFVESLSSYVGQIVTAIPIEINREKQKAVFSHRIVLEQERKNKEDDLYTNLKINQSISGKVTRIAPYGAFIDIGGIEGLAHISELSWQRVNSPEEVINVGDEVVATVKKIDTVARKISLSLKQLHQDPWNDNVNLFKEGSIYRGVVSKILNFGAFVELAKGIEGLVHISEISDKKIANAADVIAVGQEVSVKVLGIDKKNKRVSLSIAEAAHDAERAEYLPYLESQQSGLTTTLADKLGKLFKHGD